MVVCCGLDLLVGRLLLLDYGAGADVGLVVLLVFYFAIRVLFGLMFGWVILGFWVCCTPCLLFVGYVVIV